MAALNTSTCTQCGQNDDHPKHVLADNVGGVDARYHFDCQPYHLKQAMAATAEGAAAIEAAESGTHGDDLRALITSSKES